MEHGDVAFVMQLTEVAAASMRFNSVEELLVSQENADDSSSSDWLAALRMQFAEFHQGKYCSVCMEHQENLKMVLLSGCDHEFCVACIKSHLEIKVRDGVVEIPCLQEGCRRLFTAMECKKFLSTWTWELLESLKKELLIPEQHKIYCPRKQCSKLMDSRALARSSASAEPSGGCVHCVVCNEPFCSVCRVEWHAGISCEKLASLPAGLRDAEGVKVYKLAKEEKWMSCNRCSSLIQRSDGCLHMTCRCGYEFCYSCGSKWNSTHQSVCVGWREEQLFAEV